MVGSQHDVLFHDDIALLGHLHNAGLLHDFQSVARVRRLQSDGADNKHNSGWVASWARQNDTNLVFDKTNRSECTLTQHSDVGKLGQPNVGPACEAGHLNTRHDHGTQRACEGPYVSIAGVTGASKDRVGESTRRRSFGRFSSTAF